MSSKGTIANRESFLENIASKMGRNRLEEVVMKPEWQCSPQWQVLKDKSQDDLIDVLKAQCERIHTEVMETSVGNLHATLLEFIAMYGGKSVITWDDPRFEEYELDGLLDRLSQDEGIEVHKWSPDLGEENLSIAARTNIGITFSDITLAESATVTLLSESGKGRAVSLLPAAYIAIVPKSTIVPRMTQAAHLIEKQIASGKEVASCVNFISGPSNSADIEMNLIVGVHGPVKTGYLIVTDR